MIKNINHIAIAVNDLEAGQRFWHELMGLSLDHVARVEDEGVDTAFLEAGSSAGGTAIELIYPFEENGVSKFLEKRGPGIHHICFEVDDINAMLAKLISAEIPLINETAKVGAGGKKFAFIHPKGTGGVLVELYELPDK